MEQSKIIATLETYHCSTLAMTRITASSIALPGSASASRGRGACSFSSSTRLMVEAGALVGWHAWKRWMCYRLRSSPPCVARRLGFMRNIAGWRETSEEMAGNGGVFIKRHQLIETLHRRNIELAQEVDDDQMNTNHTKEPVGDEFINRR